MREQNQWIDSLQRERMVSRKDWTTAIILSVFLGVLGADRFYTGRFDLGSLKLISLGGCFVWWLIDVVLLLCGRMRDGLDRPIRHARSL